MYILLNDNITNEQIFNTWNDICHAICILQDIIRNRMEEAEFFQENDVLDKLAHLQAIIYSFNI